MSTNPIIFLQNSSPILCNTISVYRTQSIGTNIFPISLGPGTGIVNIKYLANPPCYPGELNCGVNFGDPNLAVPDKFTIIWNGISYTSGYRGGEAFLSILNSALVAAGQPAEGLSGNGEGSLSFNKNLSEPSTATLIVDSPIYSTRWSVEVLCDGLVLPTPTPTPTPTVTQTISLTPSISSTTTPTPTPTNTTTPTNTPTSSHTPTPTVTSTQTPTNTPTISITPSISPTVTNTPSNTPTTSITPSITPTKIIASPTPSITPTNNVSIEDIPLVPTRLPSPKKPDRIRQINKSVSDNLKCNKNGIFNILTQDFHNTFTKSIDTLLSSGGLSVPCILKYSSPLQPNKLCNNCIYNNTTNSSAGIFSGVGSTPFPEGSVCPVCLGKGVIVIDNYEEVINMLVIFDSKHFINLPTDSIRLADSMAQTICCISLYPKIKNAHEAILNSSIREITDRPYERVGEPQPIGLGKSQYVLTTWKRK